MDSFFFQNKLSTNPLSFLALLLFSLCKHSFLHENHFSFFPLLLSSLVTLHNRPLKRKKLSSPNASALFFLAAMFSFGPGEPIGQPGVRIQVIK
jgi:hypothetical protein